MIDDGQHTNTPPHQHMSLRSNPKLGQELWAKCVKLTHYDL